MALCVSCVDRHLYMENGAAGWKVAEAASETSTALRRAEVGEEQGFPGFWIKEEDKLEANR